VSDDFRRQLIVLMNGASLTDSGMAFQMRGAEKKKARWPVTTIKAVMWSWIVILFRRQCQDQKVWSYSWSWF